MIKCNIKNLIKFTKKKGDDYEKDGVKCAKKIFEVFILIAVFH